MKICWCCTIRSVRPGRHNAAPWTPAFNPYWEVNGVTFVDRDGYRTVLQNRAWGVVGDESHVAAS